MEEPAAQFPPNHLLAPSGLRITEFNIAFFHSAKEKTGNSCVSENGIETRYQIRGR
ncbi:MAG: hypothetical protein HYW48_11100 [Deltaproteobacteria bacterium]|nr:hypothetical protein [Deltaproteobacteria bacterium]